VHDRLNGRGQHGGLSRHEATDHAVLARCWQLAQDMEALADSPGTSPGDLDARGTLRAAASLLMEALRGEPP
jgi:hypothetical protein